MWRLFFSALAVLFALALDPGLASRPAAAQAVEPRGVVVLMYHRFGDDRYPSTNTPIAQLEAHIAELKSAEYSVMALPEVLKRLREGTPLPARTVAITIDDAYRSTYERGLPLFKAAGLPVTIFTATDPLDEGQAGYMSWDDLRALDADPLVTLAHHTKSHPHLPALTPEEIDLELEAASARFAEELGAAPEIFAYPYGEYGLREMAAARDHGFTAAFGQQSGALQPPQEDAGFFDLPRFALNEAYGDLARFRQVLNAIPLGVVEVTPRDTVFLEGETPPPYGFTVAEEVGPLDGLACYVSHGIGHKMEVLGRRVELRFTSAFPVGRVRINCTLYAGEGRWRWFGRLFTVLAD